MKVRDVLQHKGSEIVMISPDATVRELVALLAEHNIGAVIVSSDGARLDGIVSERDVVRNLQTLEPLSEKPVSAIMTEAANTCAPGSEVGSLRVQMTEQRVRHLPVLDDGKLVGIISIGDVVKSAIDELQFERDQLHNYVNQ